MSSLENPQKHQTNREIYLKMRAEGRELHERLFQKASLDPVRVAKAMTLPVPGKTLVFQDEVTMAAFSDFALYEYRVNGTTALERFDPLAEGISALQMNLLEAARVSRTSLFEIGATDPAAGTLMLRDLLTPSLPPVVLTDLQFSASVRRMRSVPVIFTRIVTAFDVSMSGGYFFPFESQLAAGLLQAYRQKMKKVPPANLSLERFVFFFNKYRSAGSPAELGNAA